MLVRIRQRVTQTLLEKKEVYFMTKPQMLGLSLLLIMVLSACGGSAVRTESTPPNSFIGSSAPHTGYVFCPTAFKANSESGSGTEDRIAVIGYRVTQKPLIYTDGKTPSGSFLQTTTTTGKSLAFTSPCYYSEDDPNFGYIDWQTP